MPQTTAVVLDRVQTRRDDIRNRLSHCGVLPICFKDEWICLENIQYIRPAFAVLRPDSRETAIRFIHVARAIQRTLPVIVFSNQMEIRRFVRNNWLADLFFLREPADDQKIQGAMALLAKSKQNLSRPLVIAGSPESQRCIKYLPVFGNCEEPLLIQGEPGVGKRLMARAIHSCSTAEKGPLEFICARDISGRWIRRTRERIDGVCGNDEKTIFTVIENMETLPMDLQSQLLLIMEKSMVRRRAKGGAQSVRFITLAENDLESLCRGGRFRKDLYHRLSVLKMTVPPLRERKDDVPVLADFFAARYSLRNKGAILRLPEEVRTVLANYPWPGNVSELKRTIRQLLETDAANWMENLAAWRPDPTGEDIRRFSASAIDVNDDVKRFLKNNRDMSLKRVKSRYSSRIEQKIMKVALLKTRGNRKKAAGLLNISYKSMLNKVKAYDLS